MGAGASAAEQAAYEQQQQSLNLESKERLKEDLRRRVAQREKTESKQGSTIDGITAVKAVSSTAAAALAPKISAAAGPKDVTSETLKALAIGNKGYRDEYREYDDTRTKLTNKQADATMDWKGMAPSPRKNGEQLDSVRPSRTGSITTGPSTTDEWNVEAPSRPVGRPAPSSSSSAAASRISLDRALGHSDNISGGKDNRKGGRGPPTIEPPDNFGPGSKHGLVTHPNAANTSDGGNPLQQIIYAPELPVVNSNSAATTTRQYPSTAAANNKDFRSSITPPPGTPPILQLSMSTAASSSSAPSSDHNRPVASSSSSSSSGHQSNNTFGKPPSGGMSASYSTPVLQSTTPPIGSIPTASQPQPQPQRAVVGVGRGAPSDNPTMTMLSTGNGMMTMSNKPSPGPQGGFGPQAPTRPSPASHPNAAGRGSGVVGGGTVAVPIPIGPGGVAVIGGGAVGRKLPVRPFPGGNPNDSSSFGMEDDIDQYSAIFTDEPSTLQASSKTPSNVPALQLDPATLAKALNEVPYHTTAATSSSSSHTPNAQLFPGAQRPNHNPPPGGGSGTSPFPTNNSTTAPSSSSAQRGLGLGTNLRVNTGTPINGKSNLSFQTAPPPKTLLTPGANNPLAGMGPGGLPVAPFPGNGNVMQTSLSTVSAQQSSPSIHTRPGSMSNPNFSTAGGGMMGMSTVGGTNTPQQPQRLPPTGTPHATTNPTFEVKETSDVKRNKAKLPTLAHAKPTRGDWLKKRYIVNNYILLDTLGTGSYGEVRLCKDRTTDQLFAIKILNKEFLKKRKGGNSNETYFEDIRREIAIMKKLKHPNVLRLFEVLDDPNVNKLYLVLEYMKKGDLVNLLVKKDKEIGGGQVAGGEGGKSNHAMFSSLSDLELWNISRQVVAGVRYLHYQNVVHGDIKPQNVLTGEDGIVKIADFGISKMLSNSGEQVGNAGGTPAFMSPELCAKESFSGQLADIWALGATIFMLKFGHPPFVANNLMELSYKIINDPLVFPFPINPGLQNLLENMMKKEVSERFTLPKVMNHPWIKHPPDAPLAPPLRRSILATNPGSGTGTAPATPPTPQDRNRKPSPSPHNNPNASTPKAAAAAAGGNATSDYSPVRGFGAVNGVATSSPSHSDRILKGGVGPPPQHTRADSQGQSGPVTVVFNGSSVNLLFQPPPNYDEEEALAMEGPIADVDGDEMFQSIGVSMVAKNKPTKKAHTSPPKGGQVNAPAPSLSTGTGTSSSNAANTSIDEGEGDIMQSNWGADVFEMVTDGGGGDDDSEDDADDDSDEDADDNDNDNDDRNSTKKSTNSSVSGGGLASGGRLLAQASGGSAAGGGLAAAIRMKQTNVDLMEDDDDMFKTKVEGDFDSSDDDDDDEAHGGGKHGKGGRRKEGSSDDDDDEDVDEDENNYGKKGITPKARFENAFNTDISKITTPASDSNGRSNVDAASSSSGSTHSQSRGNMSVEEETMRARRFQKEVSQRKRSIDGSAHEDVALAVKIVSAVLKNNHQETPPGGAAASSSANQRAGGTNDASKQSSYPRGGGSASGTDAAGAPAGSSSVLSVDNRRMPGTSKIQHYDNDNGTGMLPGLGSTGQRGAVKESSSHSDLGISSKKISNTTSGKEEESVKVEVLSMDEFSFMMDTLSQQPSFNPNDDHHGKKKPRGTVESVDSGDDDDDDDDIGDSPNPKTIPIKPTDLIAQFKNRTNGLGAAFYSDKGIRDRNEDKLALVIDVADFYLQEILGGGVGDTGNSDKNKFNEINALLQDQTLDVETIDSMHKLSVACLFDGHSGDKTSEYLSKHFPKMLVTHPKLLDKTPDAALNDVCKMVDENVCDYLFECEDISGSTGLIVVYDGRKSILTVANVGDSMCVLSRAGRAIKMHRQHRLDDEAEKKRVEAAGGQVLKNRVQGVLAISRAFGDTRFKDGDGPAAGAAGGTTRQGGGLTAGPVIAVPDVYSEVCTPHTEFCIIATDGLWDVMTPQQAVNFVRTKMSKKVELQACAKDLAMEATKKRGSVDNVTVIVLWFHLGNTPIH